METSPYGVRVSVRERKTQKKLLSTKNCQAQKRKKEVGLRAAVTIDHPFELMIEMNISTMNENCWRCFCFRKRWGLERWR
jgi:hypothetical protein